MPGAMMPGFYNHNYHILQTPDHVAIVVEMIHDTRIIRSTDAGRWTRPFSSGWAIRGDAGKATRSSSRRRT